MNLKQKSKQLKQRKTVLERFFRNSATLAVARITSAAGFITSVVGTLDWSPLLGMTGLNWKQVAVAGGIVILIGVSTEVARRRTL